jgi:hypothetical protein
MPDACSAHDEVENAHENCRFQCPDEARPFCAVSRCLSLCPREIGGLLEVSYDISDTPE